MYIKKNNLIYRRMDTPRAHVLVISLYPKQIKVRFFLNPLNLWIWRNRYFKPLLCTVFAVFLWQNGHLSQWERLRWRVRTTALHALRLLMVDDVGSTRLASRWGLSGSGGAWAIIWHLLCPGFTYKCPWVSLCSGESMSICPKYKPLLLCFGSFCSVPFPLSLREHVLSGLYGDCSPGWNEMLLLK